MAEEVPGRLRVRRPLPRNHASAGDQAPGQKGSQLSHCGSGCRRGGSRHTRTTSYIAFPGAQRHVGHSQLQTRPPERASTGLWGEDTKTPRHTVGTTSPVFWVHPAHHLPTCASEGGLNQECRQKGGNGVVVGIQLYSPDRTIRFQVWKCLNR